MEASQEWLRGHHARTVTAPEVVDGIVRRAVGSGVASAQRVVVGQDNEV
jgi:hypothetical protein